MDYYICKEDELYHYGVKGMRWSVRKAERAKNTNSMYRKNKKISSDFRNSKGKSDSYEKTMTYIGSKSSQALIRRNDRAKMVKDLRNSRNKNRGWTVAKAFIKTNLKDTAVSAIPTAAITAGTMFLTGNPTLAISIGNLTSIGTNYGIAGTRIYNMAKNK